MNIIEMLASLPPLRFIAGPDRSQSSGAPAPAIILPRGAAASGQGGAMVTLQAAASSRRQILPACRD